jgi:hypothetical protein
MREKKFPVARQKIPTIFNRAVNFSTRTVDNFVDYSDPCRADQPQMQGSTDRLNKQQINLRKNQILQSFSFSRHWDTLPDNRTSVGKLLLRGDTPMSGLTSYHQPSAECGNITSNARGGPEHQLKP